ncbi:uncharacterized protein LOC101846086 [Aplysia californica]|uniref:Uncharacterized protein LOC101846086 n=1 Tax=Aplysia californica TaxID=6500 RepID=A0ABM1A7U6_APLCA|nr:uncharacterized protein LOC101846086 [Aplysia californica]
MGRKRKAINPEDALKSNLPPCRVCEAPGAGFHYGANTCEACKGFFHRSLRLHSGYRCEAGNNCVIEHGRGKLCQLCRYKKCISVGMAKEAIKTGRYTSSKRTNDILEVKSLENKRKLGLLDNGLVNDNGSLPPTSVLPGHALTSGDGLSPELTTSLSSVRGFTSTSGLSHTARVISQALLNELSETSSNDVISHSYTPLNGLNQTLSSCALGSAPLRKEGRHLSIDLDSQSSLASAAGQSTSSDSDQFCRDVIASSSNSLFGQNSGITGTSRLIQNPLTVFASTKNTNSVNGNPLKGDFSAGSVVPCVTSSNGREIGAQNNNFLPSNGLPLAGTNLPADITQVDSQPDFLPVDFDQLVLDGPPLVSSLPHQTTAPSPITTLLDISTSSEFHRITPSHPSVVTSARLADNFFNGEKNHVAKDNRLFINSTSAAEVSPSFPFQKSPLDLGVNQNQFVNRTPGPLLSETAAGLVTSTSDKSNSQQVNGITNQLSSQISLLNNSFSRTSSSASPGQKLMALEEVLSPSSIVSSESMGASSPDMLMSHGVAGLVSSGAEQTSQGKKQGSLGPGSVKASSPTPASEAELLHAFCDTCGCGLDHSNIGLLYRRRDEVIARLAEAHESFMDQCFGRVAPEDVAAQQKEHYEQCRLKQEVFGKLTSLNDAEYDEIFIETGLDADDRQKRMEGLIDSMEKFIRGLVQFAKVIPGFNMLDLSEKIGLIKYSRQEICVASATAYFDYDLRVFKGVDGKWKCEMDMLYQVSIAPSMLEELFEFFHSLQNLGLNKEEMVLLKTIIIMAPDRDSEPQISALGREVHWQLVQTLVYLLEKRMKKPMAQFARIIDWLMTARTKEKLVREFFKSFKFEKYSRLGQAPLLREMLSGIYFDLSDDES